uniref:Uncharacterized protein n=1 Tax=Rhizophora mucronata TaxID=61149 RepID=A0A2P2KZT6_RHIMU
MQWSSSSSSTNNHFHVGATPMSEQIIPVPKPLKYAN